MSTLSHRFLGPTFLILVSLLFVSYHPNELVGKKIKLEKGSCLLKVQTPGSGNFLFTGKSDFKVVRKTSRSGEEIVRVELHLQKVPGEGRNSINFVFAGKNISKGLSSAKFRTGKPIDGFIKDFDGLFGFADFTAQGEQPFFIEQGEIELSSASAYNLSGGINAVLKNPEGKQLIIKGNFDAIPGF